MFKLLLIVSLYAQTQKDTTYPPVSNYSPIKTTAASNPVALKIDLLVNHVHQLPTGAVRIVYDSLNKIIYTNTFEGMLQTDLVNGTHKIAVIYLPEHNINRMQGLLYITERCIWVETKRIILPRTAGAGL
jgi:hypothetical protein